MRNIPLKVLTAFALTFVVSAVKAETPTYVEMQINCLARAVYEEARSQSVDVQIKVAQVILARTDDTDPQWPKHVCRNIYLWKQFSWANGPRLFKQPSEHVAFALARMIARDLYTNRRPMPHGWECVRNFERTDFKGASKRGREYFEKKLVPVARFGSFTAYKSKLPCRHPLRGA